MHQHCEHALLTLRPFLALKASVALLVLPTGYPCSLSNARCQQYLSTASMHYLLRAPFGPWEHPPCRVALLAPPFKVALLAPLCIPFGPWEHPPRRVTLIVPHAEGRASAGAGHGRGPQPAVWRGAAVLRWRWSLSLCRGAVLFGLHPFAGGGWLVLLRSCDACSVVGGGLR